MIKEWIVIGLMLVAIAASFAAGKICERNRRKAQMRRKPVRLVKLKKNYDWRV